MATISVSETTTFRWTFEEDVFSYLKSGIRAMGVWQAKLSDFGEAKGIELLQETGMEVSQLFWAGGFTGSDGRSYVDAVNDARRAIETAAAMQAGCLVVYSGGLGGHTHSHARRLFNGALEELLKMAEDLDVILALKSMHPGCASQWTILTNLDDTLALVDALGSPQLKIALDTYQFGFDKNIVDRIGEIVSHLAIVQLGDGRRPPRGDQNRCMLGHGIVPLPAIVNALAAAGYVGYYDVELLGEDIEGIGYTELLEHARTAVQQLVGESTSTGKYDAD